MLFRSDLLSRSAFLLSNKTYICESIRHVVDLVTEYTVNITADKKVRKAVPYLTIFAVYANFKHAVKIFDKYIQRIVFDYKICYCSLYYLSHYPDAVCVNNFYIINANLAFILIVLINVFANCAIRVTLCTSGHNSIKLNGVVVKKTIILGIFRSFTKLALFLNIKLRDTLDFCASLDAH
ncbi:hypothetical protein FF38_06484 [Lucilia cuprina]|uniref:Uncharacterized protein n=1 Tax=Lucilia cuprina TaxID=7375 RepID=A0A0L0BMC9_LUCCU|nr:hypothetical protein FF38_06484 [Lucilia cuprina]